MLLLTRLCVSSLLHVVLHVVLLVPAEFLYLESFLQTLKREWTGIDRLRMDKFFQVSVRRMLDIGLALVQSFCQ